MLLLTNNTIFCCTRQVLISSTRVYFNTCVKTAINYCYIKCTYFLILNTHEIKCSTHSPFLSLLSSPYTIQIKYYRSKSPLFNSKQICVSNYYLSC